MVVDTSTYISPSSCVHCGSETERMYAGMSDVYNDLFAPRLVGRKNLCNTEQVVLEVYDFCAKIIMLGWGFDLVVYS